MTLAAGSVEEMTGVSDQIQARRPRVAFCWRRHRVLQRGADGMVRDQPVNDVFGLAHNDRLLAEINSEMAAARTESEATGKPAGQFKDCRWSTLESWSRTGSSTAMGSGRGARPIPASSSRRCRPAPSSRRSAGSASGPAW
jgi:hypothetical protein